MLAQEDFFPETVSPADPRFKGAKRFQFQSQVATPWAENNVVHGKLFRAGKDWQTKPSVLLVHGWNGELGYLFQFPFLAKLLNREGMNAAMIELPYHAQRRPHGVGAINNFISPDLVRMLEATRQAMADLRAMLAWLRGQGSPVLGIWGVSLGAWLAGLVAATDHASRFTVLMAPIMSLDHAIRDLAFCAPIRESLAGRKFDLAKLNLTSHRPLCGPDKVLILESIHDLFAPVETVEHVWKSWGQPEIWRLRHGHISVLASVPTMYRATRWITRLLGIDRSSATG